MVALGGLGEEGRVGVLAGGGVEVELCDRQ
jgi:hypothetical protein